ncbi:DUF1513 domain-containing protein [Aliikangiella sp. IMCC44359]|uniref:DUF1513 domain-containing protein n=1 Tax=Aliikangiella sp. IMCC44359 TaxID=3459125 RepID=UPI00403B3068
MKLTRREFILASMSAMLTACTQSTSHNNGNIILGGGQYIKDGEKQISFVLSVVNLETKVRDLTPMVFLAHGIHRNPTNKNQLAIFEKKGPHACEYDLSSRKITRSIPKINNRYFYGHGAYSLDGKILFSTETELTGLNGLIGIRNSSDLTYLGEFPSYGKEPHECKLIDNGKTLVVTNGGGDKNGEPPSVTYIDVNSQKLIEKVELTRAELNTGHLAIGEKGDLVVVSAPRAGLGKEHLGGVSIRPKGQRLESISNPEAVTQKMLGEALSVSIHNKKRIAVVTHPDGNMVTFWSIADRKLLKVLDMPRPRGVELTVDQSQFLISYGNNANLATVSVDTLELEQSAIIYSSYITGSHIYNWSREMNEIFYPG